jgi:cytochrome c oxidase subunit IV
MSAEITTHLPVTEADAAHVKRIWKAFWVLLILTIIELALGLTIYYIEMNPDYSNLLVLMIKGVICILTLGKAFYIISIFMHLGDEVRQLILTLALPATLFIWFITAFIADGASFRNLRNTDGGSRIYVQPKDFHNVPLEAPAEKKDKKLD